MKIGKIVSEVVQARRNLPDTSTEKWEVDIPQRYGDKTNFLKMFNPDLQTTYAKGGLRCFTGSAPELVRVAKVYGEEIAESWLEIQIHDLALFTGCKDKMTIEQIRNTARVIALNYGFLKVTELMVFFQRFKAGFYGKFYGAVDGLVITSALHEFLPYREKMIEEAIRKENNVDGEDVIRGIEAYENYLKSKENEYNKRTTEDQRRKENSRNPGSGNTNPITF